MLAEALSRKLCFLVLDESSQPKQDLVEEIVNFKAFEEPLKLNGKEYLTSTVNS